MRIIETSELNPRSLSRFEELQVYNGIDSCITFEIYGKLPNKNHPVYRFELALQAPILEMNMRGVKVDVPVREKARVETLEKINKYERILDQFGEAYGLPEMKKAKRLPGEYVPRFVNANSGPSLRRLFYDYFGVPAVKRYSGGDVSNPMDEKVLSKLKIEYIIIRPLVSLVLEIRRLGGEYKRLKSAISCDGRAHTSYKIAGTETGRLASSSWTDGTRQNLQNVAEELRHIFIADPGWKMGSIDKEQAESRMVGWMCGILFGDWKYLDFCEKRDVHTHFVRLVWPELPWTGDDKLDKKLASDKKHPLATHGLHLRDKCKRIGHGANYYGTFKTLAAETYLSVDKVEEAVARYFSEFSAIPLWQQHVIDAVRNEKPVMNPFGWARRFLGYPNSSETWRQAIAYGPQSAIAHMTNLGMLQCHTNFGPRIRLLMQNHDNIVFLFREDDDENEVMSLAMKWFEVPLHCRDREMIIPGEAYTGYNWGYRKEIKDDGGNTINVINPRGLVKWDGK
jgi:DNA polymerase-1